LKDSPPQETVMSTALVLNEEPLANVSRYEQLRTQSEVHDVT
jgi:hypothetical protein